MPIVDAIGEDAIADRGNHIAVGYGEKLQIKFGHVHGFNGQASIRGFGQHIGSAGEGHLGRAVAHIHCERDIFHQNLAACRRKPRAERGLIARTMFHAAKAERISRGFDRKLGIWQFDIGTVINARLHQRLGEIGADAGIGAIGFNAMFCDPEAILGDGLL